MRGHQAIQANMIHDGQAWGETRGEIERDASKPQWEDLKHTLTSGANIFIIEDGPTYSQNCQENQ